MDKRKLFALTWTLCLVALLRLAYAAPAAAQCYGYDCPPPPQSYGMPNWNYQGDQTYVPPAEWQRVPMNDYQSQEGYFSSDYSATPMDPSGYPLLQDPNLDYANPNGGLGYQVPAEGEWGSDGRWHVQSNAWTDGLYGNQDAWNFQDQMLQHQGQIYNWQYVQPYAGQPAINVQPQW